MIAAIDSRIGPSKSKKEGISLEAGKVAQRLQEQSDMGSQDQPLHGGRNLQEAIAVVWDFFAVAPVVKKRDSRYAAFIEHLFNDPEKVFSKNSFGLVNF